MITTWECPHHPVHKYPLLCMVALWELLCVRTAPLQLSKKCPKPSLNHTGGSNEPLMNILVPLAKSTPYVQKYSDNCFTILYEITVPFLSFLEERIPVSLLSPGCLLYQIEPETYLPPNVPLAPPALPPSHCKARSFCNTRTSSHKHFNCNLETF